MKLIGNKKLSQLLNMWFYYDNSNDIKRERGTTLGLRNIPDGSVVTNHPSLHPGTIHLFESDPRVRTGAIEPYLPIGTKGLSPKAKCP